MTPGREYSRPRWTESQNGNRPPISRSFFASGEKLFLENRKGITNLSPGAHTLEVTALEKPVTLLGAFVYGD